MNKIKKKARALFALSFFVFAAAVAAQQNEGICSRKSTLCLFLSDYGFHYWCLHPRSAVRPSVQWNGAGLNRGRNADRDLGVGSRANSFAQRV